ncbi:MAG: Rne/Rng family ribonuclease [Actinobacteria bacterium]|nr:Rne/Rng family ribonuclease [Actinomycetota bacterium]
MDGVKTKELMISTDNFETRVAVLEDRKLVEIYIERTDATSIVGNIYLGRVRDILPGMQAAFIDIGIERTAFLYVGEIVYPKEEVDQPAPPIQHLLKQGQDILVQVIKEPMDAKGARVTTEITIPGRYLVLLPFSDFVGISRRLDDDERARLREIVEVVKPMDMGLIVRTAAAAASEDDLKDDVRRLVTLWNKINRRAKSTTPVKLIYSEPELAIRIVRDLFSADYRRLSIDDVRTFNKVKGYLEQTSPELVRKVEYYSERLPLFDKYNINDEIDAALRRKVWLRSGGYITIDDTEALTAIDVNTGKFVGKTSLEETIFKTNLEAAEEVVRHLRLRDIGGIIVIDFIDMAKQSNREEVFRVLNEALAKDRTKSRVIEISKLGLVEMTRKNVAQNLQEFLGETCAWCGGTGRVLSKKTTAIQVFRMIREAALLREAEAFLYKINPLVLDFFEDHGKLKDDKLKVDVPEKLVYVVSDETVPIGQAEMLREGSRREVEGMLG